MNITGSRVQEYNGFTNWVLRASLANKHKLGGKKKLPACYFVIWCNFRVAKTSSQHLLQVSLFSGDIFSGLLILFEMISTLYLS